jgi:hypothetical protein
LRRCWLLLALLAGLDSGVATAAPDRSSAELTLAEARRLSTKDLARRVFGLAGEKYVESKVTGNTGWPYVSGLISIDFAALPRSAGFPGLCEVEIVSAQFRPSPDESGGKDPPATVDRFYQRTRFAILATREAAGGTDVPDSQDRQCEALRPIFREQSSFFGGTSLGSFDFRAVDAAFAARAFLQAQAKSGSLPSIGCKGEADRPGDDLCRDPVSVLRGFPAQQVAEFGVDRCPDSPAHFCVTARAERTPSGGLEGHDLVFTIVTDATSVDPPKPFDVTAASIRGEHWAV